MLENKKDTLVDRFGLDFNLNIEEEDNGEIEETEELQRTVSWRMIRNGCWSASMGKDLMVCNSKGGRMSWDNPYKALEFGSGVIKVIYAIAMARKRGYYIESDSGMSAKYGTAVEPLIFELSKKHFAKEKLRPRKVGFKYLTECPKAGVSSDLEIIDVYDQLVHNGEIKACVTWETHYNRCFDLMDEKGTDFWQVQMQMLAHKVPSTIYIVSEPPTDIKKYVFATEIMELLPDFEKECQISYQKVLASTLHQKALLTRIDIAEKVVQRWLEEDGNLKDIFYEEIDLKKAEFKDSIVFISPSQTEKILEENHSFFSEEEIKNNIEYHSLIAEEEEEDLSEIVDEMVEKSYENIDLSNPPIDIPF